MSNENAAVLQVNTGRGRGELKETVTNQLIPWFFDCSQSLQNANLSVGLHDMRLTYNVI